MGKRGKERRAKRGWGQGGEERRNCSPKERACEHGDIDPRLVCFYRIKTEQ